MKSISLLIVLISINKIVGETTTTNNIRNDRDNEFTIPMPRVCENSKTTIYVNLIKKSNKNFISAYQRYMPKECNYPVEIVRIVEAYRNAANYVVIFLNKRNPSDEQFNEVVELYDSALNHFIKAIRTLSATKRLTNACHNSLMMMERAITSTGEGLVAGAVTTYNRKCPDNSLTYQPIQFVSNYLN